MIPRNCYRRFGVDFVFVSTGLYTTPPNPQTHLTIPREHYYLNPLSLHNTTNASSNLFFFDDIEDRCSILLRNFGNGLPINTKSYYRRLLSSAAEPVVIMHIWSFTAVTNVMSRSIFHYTWLWFIFPCIVLNIWHIKNSMESCRS
jgi:hypothetical protein